MSNRCSLESSFESRIGGSEKWKNEQCRPSDERDCRGRMVAHGCVADAAQLGNALPRARLILETRAGRDRCGDVVIHTLS
jgi:hypothetical protein